MPGLFSGLRHPISSARAGRAGAGTFNRNFRTRGTRYAIGAARRYSRNARRCTGLVTEPLWQGAEKE